MPHFALCRVGPRSRDAPLGGGDNAITKYEYSRK